jgi:hypothetical protein
VVVHPIRTLGIYQRNELRASHGLVGDHGRRLARGCFCDREWLKLDKRCAGFAERRDGGGVVLVRAECGHGASSPGVDGALALKPRSRCVLNHV